MKTCKRCNKRYDIELFGKNKTAKDGYRNICKECTKAALTTKPRDAYSVCRVCKEEKQRVNFAYHTNICKICKNNTEKEKRDKNRDEYNTRVREWRAANKDRINADKRTREKERRDMDPMYRLRHNLSTRLYMAVSKKVGNTFELVGCSKDDLVTFLEAEFEEGMSWDNYGEWHVDHVKPCCSFNLEVPEEQKKCFHWTNLQPLWARDNLSKGGKV
jgi:hypothetical protein